MNRDDIHHPIGIDRGSGRLGLERSDALHVEQMMLQVLMTSPGERVNRPDFGCGIRRLVFAPNSEVSAHLLKVTIYQALDRWLGTRIRVNDVIVRSIDAVLDVRIVYTLIATGERRFLNLEVGA